MAKKQSFGQRSKKNVPTELVVKVVKAQKSGNTYSFKEKFVKVSIEDGVDKVIEEMED